MAKRTTAGRKAQNGADPHARVRQLYQALAQGQAPAVEREARRHLRKRPADVVMLRVLGASLFLQGRSAEAADPLRRSLKIDPNHAQSWDRLGISLDARGEHDEAAKAYAKALDLDPSQPTSWTNAAQNAQQRGDYDEAERLAREGLRRTPDEPELLQALARALRAQTRYPEALVAVQRARRVQPDNVAAISLEISILERLGRTPEAIDLRVKQVKLRPDKGSFRDALIAQLIGENRLDEADALVSAPEADRVLRPVRRHYFRGRVAEARGHNNEALSAYDEAIAEDPGEVDATRRFIMLTSVAPDSDLAHQLRLRVDDKSNEPGNRAKFAYFLGQIYWNASEFSAAMDWIARANALFREHVVGKGPMYEDGPCTISGQAAISICTQDTLQAGIPGSNPDQRPMFVLGMPRSGKTLIEGILTNHPDVAAAGESNEAMRLVRELVDDWTSPHFDIASVHERLTESPPETTGRLAAEYVERLSRFGPRAERIVQTLPFYIPLTGALHTLFPEARFIFCRRAVDDVGLSCYAKDFFSEALAYTTDLHAIGREIRACEKLMAHWQEALPEGLALTIDYETLVREPDETAAQLFRHLGLEPVPFADDDEAHAGSSSFALTTHLPGRPRTDFIGIAEPVRDYLEPLRRGYEDGPGW